MEVGLCLSAVLLFVSNASYFWNDGDANLFNMMHKDTVIG